MRVLVTDADYGALDIEAQVLAAAGHELLTAQCRTPEEVIAAAQDVDAVLVQYAPSPPRRSTPCPGCGW